MDSHQGRPESVKQFQEESYYAQAGWKALKMTELLILQTLDEWIVVLREW